MFERSRKLQNDLNTITVTSGEVEGSSLKNGDAYVRNVSIGLSVTVYMVYMIAASTRTLIWCTRKEYKLLLESPEEHHNVMGEASRNMRMNVPVQQRPCFANGCQRFIPSQQQQGSLVLHSRLDLLFCR
ncbi:UNVERIFIED_CONTAM: hypothetical protein FKN15_026831 [Acipenser sinensis]